MCGIVVSLPLPANLRRTTDKESTRLATYPSITADSPQSRSILKFAVKFTFLQRIAHFAALFFVP